MKKTLPPIQPFWNLSQDQALLELATDKKGLDNAQVRLRSKRYGTIHNLFNLVLS